ncbi:pyridoxamine 5'-phosphate oxidase family protein [Yoonia sp. BS5-3]|uniref:Pyridoxamine 5'-phosphate oxidase family protein n=1 Tax=Yoonia phaeophyticola TaxID=3137369 RepID=A0ABZ2VBT3_9RHOB
MTDWFETQSGLLDKMWTVLTQGVADAKHPARRPTFATVGGDGWPEARTLVLRSADRADAALTLHTDVNSGKMASLRSTPRAALHIWDATLDLQIRLQAEVTIETGASTRALWDQIPDHARQSYGVVPAPGTRLAQALDYVKKPGPHCFAVLHCALCTIDLVHLGAQHRRAGYSRARHWQGQWLSP